MRFLSLFLMTVCLSASLAPQAEASECYYLKKEVTVVGRATGGFLGYFRSTFVDENQDSAHLLFDQLKSPEQKKILQSGERVRAKGTYSVVTREKCPSAPVLGSADVVRMFQPKHVELAK
jgi:hypothetical protein